jgi:rhodanese-related sulfurtransferase
MHTNRITALIFMSLFAVASWAAEAQRLDAPVATNAPPSARQSGTNNIAFQNLSVEEFAKMADDKRNVILDVRTPEEFQAGHLPRAVNLDVKAPDFREKAAALDKSKTYLVHCASGARSVRACEALSHLDFPKLYNLPGGFKAWVKAGKPVEK